MTIQSESSYQQALTESQRLLEHEPANDAAISTLRDTIAAYEHGQGYELPPPQTLVGRLELEMYRRRLNKKKLAELLEISDSRLSDVFQGRRINLDLARRLHTKLGIPGDFSRNSVAQPHALPRARPPLPGAGVSARAAGGRTAQQWPRAFCPPAALPGGAAGPPTPAHCRKLGAGGGRLGKAWPRPQENTSRPARSTGGTASPAKPARVTLR